MRNNWTREETIIAFNLYCKIPFKDSSSHHPLVVEYARLIGRTPSALNMKIGNIGRLDPELRSKGITGLAHGAKIEQAVWEEFNADPERLAYESEQLMAKFGKMRVEDQLKITPEDLPQGTEREVIVRQRVNQSFFRSAVMGAYDFTCCISGIHCPKLVEACHIVDWADDPKNRTNPRNGLCLNPFFHTCYDRNLMAITPDYEVVLREEVIAESKETNFRDYLCAVDHRRIRLPDRFLPAQDLLAEHYERFKRL